MSTEQNIFEQASRLGSKVRFNSTKGASSLMVEDLWSLPLTSTAGKTSLSGLAAEIDEAIGKTSGSKFLRGGSTPADKIEQLKLDLVVHVIRAKEAEADEASKRRKNLEELSKLQEIIRVKENEALVSTDIETLKKRAEELAAQV